MRRLGLFIFGGGVIGGLIFVRVVGSGSAAFHAYFGYFIAAYMLGTLLIVFGRRKRLPRPINENTPDAAIAHNNRGWEYHKHHGALDAAIAEYDQAVTIEPNYPEAWNNLGLAYGEKGLIDRAISCLERTVTLAPGLASAHNDLAIGYFSKGQKQLALKHALKAKELGAKVDPEFMKLL